MKRNKCKLGTLKKLLFIVTALLLFTGCFARTSKIDNPHAIAELTPIEIGGLQQWLLIRGEDRSNPILLWLHGGPGSAQMPVHRAFNKELEREFIVVHWDQRGAGKSNHKNFLEETMTLDRFVEDVHEMTHYLKKRFGREQIFLIGHSWGTQLGIHTVNRYPDDYDAFISIGQVVHPERAGHISYNWLKERVEEEGIQRQRNRFDQLGQPPFTEHDLYVSLAKMLDEFGGGMDVGMGRLAWISLGAKEYTIGDYVRWLRGANRGSGPMWEETSSENLFEQITQLKLPIWFIVGENDYNTPALLVQEYYEFVEVTQKQLLIMEGCSHAPFMGDPEKFNEEMFRIKKSLANKAGEI